MTKYVAFTGDYRFTSIDEPQGPFDYNSRRIIENIISNKIPISSEKTVRVGDIDDELGPPKFLYSTNPTTLAIKAGEWPLQPEAQEEKWGLKRFATLNVQFPLERRSVTYDYEFFRLKIDINSQNIGKILCLDKSRWVAMRPARNRIVESGLRLNGPEDFLSQMLNNRRLMPEHLILKEEPLPMIFSCFTVLYIREDVTRTSVMSGLTPYEHTCEMGLE